mmetsp:Transcript_78175/g.117632  ORF Transcript_78175/g.117632 Transcript_78175/m.117632 type:complete len:86 (+) Transcript_78175:48-305(+)
MIFTDEITEKEDMDDILRSGTKFYDPNYSADRVVTALEWSPNMPEVFLAGYSQNENGSINDPIGVVLLWSLNLRSRPEFYCFCQS